MTTTSLGGAVPATGGGLTRRGLLAVSAGTGLVASGCSGPDDSTPERAEGARPTPSSVGGETPGEGATDDADLVGEAREALAASAALVTASRRSVPSLRADLDPLLRLHEAHVAALGQPLEPIRTARRAAPAGPLLRLVRDREEQLQARLVDLSVQADSGALARLLASMSAGLSQRLAVLPTTIPRRPTVPRRPGGGA